MLFQQTSLSALAAITFLAQASTSVAGHARSRPQLGHRHHARSNSNLEIIGRRDAGSVEVPTGELQMLQSEITTFQGWMNTYINSASSMEPASAITQLKQEFEAFDGWMTAFLDAVMGTGAPTLPPLPTTAAIISTAQASVAALASSSSPAAPIPSSLPAGLVSSSPTAAPVSTTPPSAPASSSSPAAMIAPSDLAAVDKNSPIADAVVGPSSASSVVAPVLYKPSHVHTSTATTPAYVAPSTPAFSAPAQSQSGSGSGSTAPTTAPSFGGSSGSFNAASNSNVAVYYGQSGATGQYTVAQMCQDPNVDIVILAFVSTYFGAGGYPTLNLGAACSGKTSAMTAKGATGLLSCPSVAQDITTCQGLGKKVLLSLGGATATSAFSSTSQADTFATQLWNIFGGGTGESSDMRPFGEVKVDGFDLDNEDHSTTYYSDFVSSLRSTMNTDKTKTYYISAAPQCPRPDASIPLDAMQSMDFVWVQFYDNAQAGCDVGQPGFVASLKAWSSDLSAKGAGPKLYIGAPGCSACAGAGYIDPGTMETVLASAKSAGVSNLGGVMLWDGPEAKGNTAGGTDYLSIVKSAL